MFTGAPGQRILICPKELTSNFVTLFVASLIPEMRTEKSQFKDGKHLCAQEKLVVTVIKELIFFKRFHT